MDQYTSALAAHEVARLRAIEDARGMSNAFVSQGTLDNFHGKPEFADRIAGVQQGADTSPRPHSSILEPLWVPGGILVGLTGIGLVYLGGSAMLGAVAGIGAGIGLIGYIAVYGIENSLEDAAYCLRRVARARRETQRARAAMISERWVKELEK